MIRPKISNTCPACNMGMRLFATGGYKYNHCNNELCIIKYTEHFGHYLDNSRTNYVAQIRFEINSKLISIDYGFNPVIENFQTPRLLIYDAINNQDILNVEINANIDFSNLKALESKIKNYILLS